jgi:Sulfotransferase family
MFSSNNPVFIVGTPRSGTTLLRLIVDSHPDISITPESSFLFRVTPLWDKVLSRGGRRDSISRLLGMLRLIPQVKDWMPASCSPDEILAHCGQEITLAAVLDSIYHLYAIEKGKTIWGDKTPKNLYSIDAIFALYPNAKVVIVVRDCRDVALSLRKADFSKASYISSAIRWQNDTDLAITAMGRHADHVKLVKYEDLLSAPEETLKILLGFCGLREEPKLLERYATHDDDVVHTKSSLYMKPVSENNLAKWKTSMPDRDIRNIEALSKKGLAYFGYPVVNSNATISPARVLWVRFYDFAHLSKNKKNLENYVALIRIFLKTLFRT